MWDYIIKNFLKKEIQEKPEIHRIHSISYIENNNSLKIQKSSLKESETTQKNQTHQYTGIRILQCPVCHVPMERKIFPLSSIEIDECPSCKGIFLDKGELQELMGYDIKTINDEDPIMIYTPHGFKSSK